MDIKVTDARATKASDLCDAMRLAFSGYAVPLNLSQSSFDFMMRQRGLDRGASRIATVNGKIAAIWLVSVRGAAAYLISSGTLPEFRSMGLAKALAADCFTGLKRRDVETFQTEVLTENTSAAALYEKIGMRPLRGLACYSLNDDDFPEGPRSVRVDEALWQVVSKSAPLLRDWSPSWQHSDLSIHNIAESVRCYCIKQDPAIVGYAVIIADTGTVAQIGVLPAKRRKGIGTALLKTGAEAMPNGRLRIVNAQESDGGFSQFMDQLKAEHTMGQTELFLRF